MEQKTVMIVDDDELMLRALSRLLGSLGCDVMAYASPFEAMEGIRSSNVSVIICDQRMPEMTGLDFLRQVRQSSPRTARILMSGYMDKELVSSVIKSGDAVAIVNKPFGNDNFEALVNRVLAGART